MARPGILNTEQRYGVVAQILHWATAILILILLPLGKYMHGLPISTSAEIEYKVWFYSLHKTLGITVFAIAILRVIWAIMSKKPEPIHPEKKLETFAAATAHWLLYISIILVPFVGYLHHASSVGFAPIWWPLPQTLPFVPQTTELSLYTGKLHFVLSAIMGITILAHIAGALKHAIFERDGTLSRIIPFKDVTLSGFVNFGRTGHRVPYSHGKAPRILAFFIIFSAIATVTTLSIIPAGTITQQIAETINPAGTEDDAANLADNDAVANTNAPNDAPNAAAGGDQWIVDPAQSKLGITIMQLGSPVSGAFATWDANIRFDPENLDQASVTVTIDMGSLTLGSVTDQAKSSDFLDVITYPQAVFAADNFTGDAAGYTANGTLAMHGVKLPVTLPFTLAFDGDQAMMKGQTTLNRIPFGVGAQGFPDEGSVAFDVIVDVSLLAKRQ